MSKKIKQSAQTEQSGKRKLSRKSLLLVTQFSLLFMGVVLYFVIVNNHNPTPAGPVGAQQIPTEPTKQTESIRYAGDDELLTRGFLAQQVADIKLALTKFADSQHTSPRTVTFSNIQHFVVKSDDGNDTTHRYEFDVALDDATYHAKPELVSDDVVRLYLYDTQDPTKLVYDSGPVQAAATAQ